MKKKPCRVCKKDKEISFDNFTRCKQNLDGFHNICKVCLAEKDKKRYEEKKKEKELFPF